MKLDEIKTTQSTTSHAQLEEFLKDGWTIVGTEEFMEGGEPPLKKTRYILGHMKPDQKLPAVLLEVYKALADAQRRR